MIIYRAYEIRWPQWGKSRMRELGPSVWQIWEQTRLPSDSSQLSPMGFAFLLCPFLAMCKLLRCPPVRSRDGTVSAPQVIVWVKGNGWKAPSPLHGVSPLVPLTLLLSAMPPCSFTRFEAGAVQRRWHFLGRTLTMFHPCHSGLRCSRITLLSCFPYS